MNCLICNQAEIAPGFAALKLERGEFRLTITRVPARICPNCGEAYVDEETATQTLRLAEKIFAEGAREETEEYKTPQP